MVEEIKKKKINPDMRSQLLWCGECMTHPSLLVCRLIIVFISLTVVGLTRQQHLDSPD